MPSSPAAAGLFFMAASSPTVGHRHALVRWLGAGGSRARFSHLACAFGARAAVALGCALRHVLVQRAGLAAGAQWRAGGGMLAAGRRRRALDAQVLAAAGRLALRSRSGGQQKAGGSDRDAGKKAGCHLGSFTALSRWATGGGRTGGSRSGGGTSSGGGSSTSGGGRSGPGGLGGGSGG